MGAIAVLAACDASTPPLPCQAVRLSAGMDKTWILTADGNSWAWGLLIPSSLSHTRVPVKKWQALDVQELSVRSAICVLTVAHTLQCNSVDSIGAITWAGIQSFGLGFVNEFSTENFAVKDDGSVWKWKTDNSSRSLDPAGGTEVSDLGHDVVAVATNGASDYLAIKTDGSLWRQPRTIDNPKRPGQVTLPGPATAVSHQLYEGYVALTDGSVYRVTRDPPELVEVAGIETLTSGQDHTCGLTNEGSVWCWGDNNLGQLGFGLAPDIRRYNSPQQVIELGNDVTSVSAGHNHTCARRSDASVWCWGDNRENQTGSSVAVSSRPTRVLGCE